MTGGCVFLVSVCFRYGSLGCGQIDPKDSSPLRDGFHLDKSIVLLDYGMGS